MLRGWRAASCSRMSTSSFSRGTWSRSTAFTPNSDPQRLGNGFGADAVQGGLFFIDDKARLGLVGFDVPVGIDHPWRVFEDVR